MKNIINPKVSVLMPIYKTNESFLREAVESILTQTFKDFEFLILDDGPDDNREAIIKSFNDKRIKYYKNDKNLGISASRNKLIDMAKGKYLAVFDHDDISLPERFEKQVQFLDEHSNIGVVGCQIKRIIKNSTSQNHINDEAIKLALMRECVICHPSSMIRKSVLEKNNIRYEEKYSPSEDYALWCRLIPHTKFHNIDEVLLLYRDHEDNTSHKQSKKMRDATIAIWSFVKKDNQSLYNEFLLKAKHTIRIKLLGTIPFIKIIKRYDRIKIYLFEKILLLSIKKSIKLREK